MGATPATRRQGTCAMSAPTSATESLPTDPDVPTPPNQPDWAPLEHAPDCATFLVTSRAERTYGGYCPAENVAAGLLWQGQKYRADPRRRDWCGA